MDSSSSSSDSRFIYDVFISFRGEDSRRSFVSHLYAALSNAGIKTFYDELLLKGTEIGSELLGAIEKSRISIVVFSKNYAGSKWCLNDLAKIMECHKAHGQVVIPVFYDVDPSDVHRQKGEFVIPFENRYSDRKLTSWRTALREAASLSGWVVANSRSEAEPVQQIVDDILMMLKRRILTITQYPVGLDTRVQPVIQFIQNQSSKVSLIGIWGMGGSGKTTTAKAIYNNIHCKFVNISFIGNVREVCQQEGIIHLKQQLLSDLLNTKKNIRSIEEGEMMINRRFQGKRVLVVLDDVTTFEQLEVLCPNPNLFGPGSVLIVTTRDAHLLKLLKVDYVCTMKEMDEKESLELFSWHAFRHRSPIEEFRELTWKAVMYCGGLPLALEVIGAYLHGRPKEESKNQLLILERIPNDRVHRVLRISYDSLIDDMEKDIFLDICCFFIGKDRAYVTEILNGCGLCADIGIAVLIDQGLLIVDNNNKLRMHGLIRDMGREIVRQSSPKELGQRSRLWFHMDVHDVLKKNSGTNTVEGLFLKSQSTNNICIKTDSFKKMKNLRLLQLDHVDLTGDFGYLSEELRWLHWQGFTRKYIPDGFCLGNLVVFELKHSNIEQVWNETKVLVNLKIFNLSHSRYLKNSPDFSKLPNLEKLIMKDCPCLSEIHPSIGDLNNLCLINFKDCTGLTNIPEKVFQLKSLKTINLSGCLKIYEKHALKNDVDAKSKGGPSKCDNQRDMDEAEEILNDVDVNRRMVEQIPYAVAESLFNRLTSTTFREHGRIYGVIEELERLKNNVECIRAVLPDAEKKQEQDCVVQDWITSLKDVLHLADDLLDEFTIEGMRYEVDACDKNQVTWVHSSDSSQNFLNQKVAPEIEKIQKKFDDVLEEMNKLKLSPKDAVVKQTDILRNKSNSFLLESDITGREDDKEEIINLLRQPHRNILSVAIVGIGGIGKTTLAQSVYNDVEVQNHFEKQMWVCVSNNFDVKTIVKKMLESLMDSKIDDKLSFEYIQHKLHESLTGERYLLVLDDICSATHSKWTQLKTYLMCGAGDSRVLMTTRSKSVSKRLQASNLYVLNGLTLEASWSVLKKITFGNETSGVDQELESIGEQIAEKCKGVPLAIRTLGGLLQSKSEEREWISVLQGDFWDKESIMSILEFSYQSLPLQLIQCFAFCSLFPKDWEIEKDMLIQLWMAQGYLECSDEKQLMEDVGNKFVKIFLMKSFFQDAKVSDDGDIVSFKMHDLMHDLAIQVAGSDCCYLDSEAKRCVQRPMHVSLELNAVHLLASLDASRLRTLILLSSNEEEELNGDELSVIFNFKHLRVLKLSNCSLSRLYGSIENLKHLRYLYLMHCRGLGSLYKSISSLVFLQTLILTPNEKMEFSSKVLSKLVNMRHLHISDWETSRDETPSGFEKLSTLQYEGMVFSNWLSSLTNIGEISFFSCGTLQYLPPLERLPFLKSLHLSFIDELEYIYYEQDFTSAFFPSLESLSLQFCYKLRGWLRIGDDFNNTNSSQNLSLPPFPHLCQLSIIGCQMLTCMPAYPDVENRLELYNCSVETLVATLNTAALESMNVFPPLSMLKSLHIDGVGLDVKRIPKDWMQNLTSLQLLQINWFSCQEFQAIKPWFKGDLKCLPSLQTIAFHNCEDLEALPDWICSLSSLQHLRVYDCINLASMPEGMPCLTNLQTLEIIGCPLLAEECQTHR